MPFLVNLFGLLALVLVTATPAADHACLRLLAPSVKSSPFPVRVYRGERKVPRFVDALPDYNAETDLMLAFEPGGHVDLYVGPTFVHTNFNPNPPRVRRSVSPGINVRVRVGKATVDRIQGFLAANSQLQCWGFSCHHNALLVLHHNGVFLRNFIPLHGASTYSKILNEGFVDAAGNPFPQDLILINVPGEDPIAATHGNLQGHDVGRSVHFFLNFAGTKEQAIVYLTDQGPLLAPLALALQEGNWNNVSESQRKMVNNFFRYFESEMLNLAEAHGGTQAWLIAQSRGQIPPAQMNEAIKASMLVAIARVRAEAEAGE